MAEFASKGVAGSGLGLGIAGTALGLLNNGGNGGLLGGLFGGGNQNVVSALQAENGMLKAENYSDKNAKEVYAQSLADNRRLRDEAFAYLKPLADESANNRVELAKLQAELKCCCEKQELREQIVLGKIKSNEFKFRTINMDESSATKTRTFKVYINVTAEISNTNFGLGNMFPRSK